MTAVNITNVTVLDNPAAFLNPFQFEISYECLVPLKDGKISTIISLFPPLLCLGFLALVGQNKGNIKIGIL